MTTTFSTDKKCAVCGKPSVQYEIGSTTSFGSPDLDTRPPDMERSTIDYWVQRCPHCGYCAEDIDEKVKGAEEIIMEAAYKDILNDEDFPDLANSFRAQAYIYEHIENYSNSAWSMINAAWVCDDEKNKQSAKQCRIKAFELIQKLWNNDEYLMEEKEAADCAVAADLLRRSEKYEQASEIINKGFAADPKETVLELLQAQKILVEKKNNLCYTIEDAEKLIENNSEND